MTVYYKPFTVTGVINTEVKATETLESTEAEPKKLIGIIVEKNTTAASNDDFVYVYDEREAVVNGLYRLSIMGENQYYGFIPCDHKIPVGHTVQAANKSGATARNIIGGAYVYEITTKT